MAMGLDLHHYPPAALDEIRGLQTRLDEMTRSAAMAKAGHDAGVVRYEAAREEIERLRRERDARLELLEKVTDERDAARAELRGGGQAFSVCRIIGEWRGNDWREDFPATMRGYELATALESLAREIRESMREGGGQRA